MTRRKSPRFLPLFLLRRIPFIKPGPVISFSLMFHHCICHRLVSEAFQSQLWKILNVSQGRAWETKSFDLEIGTMSCDVVLSISRRPTLMLPSCCSLPGTRSHESYPTLLDTVSILQTERSKVDRFGLISCTRRLAFIIFLRLKLPSS